MWLRTMGVALVIGVVGVLAAAGSDSSELYQNFTGDRSLRLLDDGEAEILESRHLIAGEYEWQDDELRISFEAMGTKLIRRMSKADDGSGLVWTDPASRRTHHYYNESGLKRANEPGALLERMRLSKSAAERDLAFHRLVAMENESLAELRDALTSARDGSDPWLAHRAAFLLARSGDDARATTAVLSSALVEEHSLRLRRVGGGTRPRPAPFASRTELVDLLMASPERRRIAMPAIVHVAVAAASEPTQTPQVPDGLLDPLSRGAWEAFLKKQTQRNVTWGSEQAQLIEFLAADENSFASLHREVSGGLGGIYTASLEVLVENGNESRRAEIASLTFFRARNRRR